MSSNTPASNGPETARVRWSRVLALVLLVLVFGEVAARAYLHRRVGKPFKSLDPHTFSGYGVYRENSDFTHPQFIQNSAGFRNTREYSIDKPPGTFRVMAIGASVLYSGSAMTHAGWSQRVHTDETITAYVEPLLRQMPDLAGYNIEVINAGVNRSFIRQTISYYVAELGRYEPDLVIVFGTNNDTINLEYAGGWKRLFFNASDPQEEERRLQLLANGGSLDALLEKLTRMSVNHSALAAGGYRVVDGGLKWIANRINTSPPPVPPTTQEQSKGPALATPAELDRNLRFYLADLGALLTCIETQGAQPAVFWEYNLLQLEGIKPFSPYEQGVAGFLKGSKIGLSEDGRRLKFEIRDRVAAYLKRRGIPLIDIVDDFRTRSANVFNDYLHYNPEGNAWVAGLVARDIAPLIRQRLANRPPN